MSKQNHQINPTAVAGSGGSDSELLLFAFEYPPVAGGISRLCAQIAGLLKPAFTGLRVLTQKSQEVIAASVAPAVRLESRRPIREWQAWRWLRNYRSKRTQNDQATICGIWYPEGLLAYLAGLRPLIILAHGAELLSCPNRWRRPWWSALQRRVLESADLVIANSGYTRDLVSTAAPRAKIAAISLAVDAEHFSPGNREAVRAKFGMADKRVLCTVSRIQHYKAHDTVLRALADLSPAEREHFIYLIAGEGPHERTLRKQVNELGLDANVRFLGFVSEEELPDVYRAADLFVLCTRDAQEERAVEGFGMVFLEAQACGIPVVGTRTGGISAAVQDGDGGWLIEQDDIQSLTGIFRKLGSSPQLFRAAGDRARKRVLDRYTWERYSQRFLSTLQVAIDHRQKKCAGSTVGPEKQQLQGVSVVVPTLNRGSFLIDTINDLLAQEHRPLEILVVDQSRTEDPMLQKLIGDHPDLISYHKVQFRGLPLARNYGWQQAKYEAIVFVDDDIRCGPRLLSEHLRALSQSNIGMVAGGIDERAASQVAGTSPGRFNSWTATPTRNFEAAGEGIVQHVPGGNFSAWRSVLRAAGGFDEALALGAALYEETELCLRVQKSGFDIYFNGAARIQHLAAGNGGCRVHDIPKYIASLAHNRAIMIGRHLRWFQVPVAYLRLFLLFISYALHYRAVGILREGFVGLLRGAHAAKHPPLCSCFAAEVRA